MTAPEPNPDLDELTTEEWWDLVTAYNYGTLDPVPGSIEARVFAQMDAYARAEVERVAAEREADEAWAAAHAAEAAPELEAEP